jgi:hypothetical protein
LGGGGDRLDFLAEGLPLLGFLLEVLLLLRQGHAAHIGG